MTHVTSLYLHVPFCKHLCNYCDFYKKLYEPGSKQFEDFHQFLSESWTAHEKILEAKHYTLAPLKTLYLGGGTPSLWGVRGAELLRQWLTDRLSLEAECEFTMEIDPGTWTVQMIDAWKAIGLNRISIGTQTLDPNFIGIMDRSHSLDESHDLLRYCSENDWNFSLDFLLGLPFSKARGRDIKKELDLLLAYDPNHISLYILNARSKYPHVQAMPEDDFIREEYLFVSQYLQGLGFHHYEVSNFAKPGFESKHNMRYWRGEANAALGPTGTGYLPNGDKALRYKWKVSRADAELEELNAQEVELEEIYLSLRTSAGWRPKNFTPKHQTLFESWKKMGFGDSAGGKITLNSLGFLMLDSLMDDYFRTGL